MMYDLADSACIQCTNMASEGEYHRETLESPAEYPEFYCEIGNDDNFGTPCGCWDFHKRTGYYADEF